jgi:hypothetical protein
MGMSFNHPQAFVAGPPCGKQSSPDAEELAQVFGLGLGLLIIPGGRHLRLGGSVPE